MSVYGPSLFYAVDISKGEAMETITELLECLSQTYATENPPPASEGYVATLVSIKIAEQLERIADALEAANKPEIHQAGSNLPEMAREWPDKWKRNKLADDDDEAQAQEWDSDTFALGADPMEPDYKALADDEPTGQIQDSRDSAGLS